MHPFPPVSKEAALGIAARAIGQAAPAPELVCHGRKPARFAVYGRWPEPCWWVQALPPAGGAPTLQSSRVIVIGRHTGRIHYDGSAGDKG
ncbi:MAG: hypothetical protein IT368_18965 [Candidatus Hydrogenedentes bacterium]|nr:hypothetical protein [Candidatus Hydrogenedentota bacterium]